MILKATKNNALTSRRFFEQLLFYMLDLFLLLMPKRIVNSARKQKKAVHFPLKRMLHTDILEQKYGPVSARVLRHDSRVRESHLVDPQGVSRTYALTFFPHEKRSSDIAAIDSEIRSGKPIGKTFREHGFEIRKNVIHVFILRLPDWLRKAFDRKEGFAKARLSEFLARKEKGQAIVYGTVLEVYSPDFRPPTINAVDMQQVNAPVEMLEKQGVSIDDVWKRIGTGNNWRNAEQKLEAAKAKSTPTIQKFERRIKQFVSAKH